MDILDPNMALIYIKLWPRSVTHHIYFSLQGLRQAAQSGQGLGVHLVPGQVCAPQVPHARDVPELHRGRELAVARRKNRSLLL